MFRHCYYKTAERIVSVIRLSRWAIEQDILFITLEGVGNRKKETTDVGRLFCIIIVKVQA